MPEVTGLPEQFCIRARTEQPDWRPLLCSSADTRIDTLKLVLNVPEFLSMGGDGPPFRVAMPAPGSGKETRALVAINEKGRVAVVGCPDVSDSRTYAGLVGDVLAATGRLWHRSYNSLAAGFKQFLGCPLEDFIAGKAGEKWSVEQFRAGVGESLSKGRIPVIVAARGINGEAGEAISYLGSMNLEVKVLGFALVKSDGVEVVFPKPAGQEEWKRTITVPGPRPQFEEPALKPAPAQREPVVVPSDATSPSVTGPAEPEPEQNPWAHTGTKPGVMSGKRPGTELEPRRKKRKGKRRNS